MKYYSIFKDLDENDIKIEIITESIGPDTELYTATDGLTINYAGDSLYMPLLKSGCSIDFMIEDIIPDFYTGKLLSPEVYIYKKEVGANDYELFWFGYVTPNAYNQPYCQPYDNITIECIDTLAQAANVDYSYIVDYANKTSFINIIKHVLNKVDPSFHIPKIFCSTSISLNSSTNILDLLSIVERNFCDEIDEASKGDECLGEICKYLGFTMFQYKDAYYIIDYNNLNSQYTEYDRTTNSVVNQLSSLPKDISTIGVRASDTNISLEGLYNKVSIVANTLKMDDPISSDNDYKGSLFGDLVQNTNTQEADYDSSQQCEKRSIWINPEATGNLGDFILYNYNIFTSTASWPKDEKVWSWTSKQGWEEWKLLNSWWKSDGDWSWKVPHLRYDANGFQTEDYSGVMSIDKAYQIEYTTMSSWLTWQQGSTWQKVAAYKADEVPTTLDWKEYFTISCQERHVGLEDKFLSYENPGMIFKGGALMINFEFYFSYNNTIAMTEMPEPNMTYDDSIANDTNTLKKERTIVFPAKLSVGDYYWNGAEWRQYTSTFLAKLNGGYFDCSLFSEEVPSTGEEVNGRNWIKYIWKIWNSTYQDWEYVTETEYNNFVGGTKEIVTIPTYTDTFGNECIYGPRIIYYIQKTSNGPYIQVEASYQNQYVSDRFFLAKKFPNGGKVYGQTYKLNNTTTYLLNLNEASEGIALPIKKDGEELTLSGTFKFSIGRPTRHFEALTPNATVGESASGLIVHISDMYVKYSQEGEVTTSNDDIVYSNVINSGYVNELDDIDMQVNTYTNKMMSYSYVLNGNDFLDKLTYNNKTQIQEHNIIEKLVNHYSNKKLVYSSTIHNDDITPCTLLTDTHINKTMPVVGIEYDMYKNYATVTCIEI